MIGGIFLIVFGYKVYTAPPVHLAKPIKSNGFLITLLQTILLTLTNPMTIAAFIAAFAAVGFNESPHGGYRSDSYKLWEYFVDLAYGLFV